MKNIITSILGLFLVISLFAQQDVLPPVLRVPANNANFQMPDVLLDWDAVSGIGVVTYEVQIDTADGFSTPVVYSTDLSSQNAEQLLFGTVYYWRVRATDQSGTSDWSSVFSFTTFNAVDLYKPNDGDDGIAPNAKLQWKKNAGTGAGVKISGIQYFDYEVSEDINFTAPTHGSLYFPTINISESWYFTNCNQLKFNSMYYWRVRARHAVDTTDWSVVRSFTTIDVVLQEEPANNAINQSLSVPVIWEAINGVFGYMYELCIDPNFSFPCMSLTDTNAVIAENLDFGENYYWRVKAYHNIDTSAWSATWTFSTINTVNLSSPADGDTIGPLPKLEWTAIAGLSKYEVQYDINQNFTEPVIEYASGSSNSFQVVFILDEGTEYFWRVRGISNGDTSNWSTVRHFYTNPPIGFGDLFLNKYNLKISPNPCSANLNIQLFSNSAEIVKITILDLLGKGVVSDFMKVQPGGNTSNINLSDLKAGYYFIRFKTDTNEYTQKLLIQR